MYSAGAVQSLGGWFVCARAEGWGYVRYTHIFPRHRLERAPESGFGDGELSGRFESERPLTLRSANTENFIEVVLKDLREACSGIFL